MNQTESGEEEQTQEQTQEQSQEASPIDELRSQYEKLKSDLEVQRQEAQSARQQQMADRAARLAAEQEAAAARSETSQVQIGSLQAGADAAQAEVEAAQIEYRAAREAGDVDREVAANTRLTRAQALLVNRSEARAYSEYEAQQRAQQYEQQQQYQQYQQPQGNSIENYIQQSRMSQRSADWVRRHPEWVSDQRKNARLIGAHYDAVDGQGLAVDSPEYFSHVERVLGLNKQEKSKAPPVLPVGSSRVSGASNEVPLTKAERETATDGTLVWHYNDPNKKFKKGDPIGVEEYARRKREMKEQGIYDKAYVSQ